MKGFTRGSGVSASSRETQASVYEKQACDIFTSILSFDYIYVCLKLFYELEEDLETRNLSERPVYFA